MSTQSEAVDFALAAYHQDGDWRLDELAHDLLDDFDTLVAALHRFPADGGALGIVAVDEDFFLLLRSDGLQTRLLLSDVTAADEWELAAAAVEHLGLPEPDDDEDSAPAGDLGLVADWGLSAAEMGSLLDEDLYPDETLAGIATHLGFGDLFDDLVFVNE